VKNYQKPLIITVFKNGLFFRCQATPPPTPPNCNADIATCDSSVIRDISIQDCELTACVIQTPSEDGFIIFDCGGSQVFMADFISVSLRACTMNLPTAVSITVEVSPDLPDNCNGNLIEYNSANPSSFVCAD
jgi:hypothetical protein